MLEVKINTTIHIELNPCSGFGKRGGKFPPGLENGRIPPLRIIGSKALWENHIMLSKTRDSKIDPYLCYNTGIDYMYVREPGEHNLIANIITHYSIVTVILYVLQKSYILSLT